MKRITAILAVVFVAAAVAMATDPTATKNATATTATSTMSWFDMKGNSCDFCQPFMAEKGLMEHMHWEAHPIATGMVGVTTVDPDFEMAYEHAHENMMGIVKRAMAGENLKMCGHCASIMAMAQAGAKMDNVDSKNVHIMTVTSTDPKVIEMAHTHAQKDTDEMAKMMAMGQEPKGE